MENEILHTAAGDGPVTEAAAQTQEKAIRKDNTLKSIHLAGDQFVIKDEPPIRSYEAFRLKESDSDLPGVFFQGTQYYDLKNIYFINNTGMANLIELLGSLLEKDVDVQFVNVCDKIKNKIKSLGLDQILICS